jgi:hypothetical protein
MSFKNGSIETITAPDAAGISKITPKVGWESRSNV